MSKANEALQAILKEAGVTAKIEFNANWRLYPQKVGDIKTDADVHGWMINNNTCNALIDPRDFERLQLMITAIKERYFERGRDSMAKEIAKEEREGLREGWEQ